MTEDNGTPIEKVQKQIKTVEEQLNGLRNEYDSDKKIVKWGAVLLTVFILSFLGVTVAEIPSALTGNSTLAKIRG